MINGVYFLGILVTFLFVFYIILSKTKILENNLVLPLVSVMVMFFMFFSFQPGFLKQPFLVNFSKTVEKALGFNLICWLSAFITLFIILAIAGVVLALLPAFMKGKSVQLLFNVRNAFKIKGTRKVLEILSLLLPVLVFLVILLEINSAGLMFALLASLFASQFYLMFSEEMQGPEAFPYGNLSLAISFLLYFFLAYRFIQFA
ncbi:MAG: hypothetical protein ACLFQV_11400 [Vulcanimicrobiota bacterium]